MGMYDEITILFDVKEIKQKSPFVLQTKDFDCTMDKYSINKDGILIHHYVEWESTPESELPYSNMPFIGCLRIKKGSEKDIPINYHGIINAYMVDIDGSYCDVKIKFTDGKMVNIETTVTR